MMSTLMCYPGCSLALMLGIGRSVLQSQKAVDSGQTNSPMPGGPSWKKTAFTSARHLRKGRHYSFEALEPGSSVAFRKKKTSMKAHLFLQIGSSCLKKRFNFLPHPLRHGMRHILQRRAMPRRTTQPVCGLMAALQSIDILVDEDLNTLSATLLLVDLATGIKPTGATENCSSATRLPRLSLPFYTRLLRDYETGSSLLGRQEALVHTFQRAAWVL